MPYMIPNLIIAAGLFILAELLRKKPPGQQPQSEPRLSTSEFGKTIPFVIGTARLSPNIVWYGDFQAQPIRKRVSLFQKQTVGYNYYLSVQDIICTGCIDRLDNIYIGEDPLLSEAIELSATDGVTTVLKLNGKDCSFTIKPGASYQTPIANLIDGITPQTAYPYICYAYWHSGSMGQGTNWSNISYVVTRYPKTYLAADVPVIVRNSHGSGVNPAHAILDILTNNLLGPVLNPLQIDMDSLVNIGRTLKDEGLFVNFAITDNTSAKEILASIFNDFGIICYEEFGRLTFKLLRQETTNIVIDNAINSLLIDAPKYSVDLKSDNANNISYDFADAALNYRINNINDFDPGSIVRNRQRKFQNKTFYFIDNSIVAQKLVQLNKSINSSGFEVNEFEITAYDKLINPGNIIIADSKKWRVTRVELRNNVIKLGVIRDPIRFVNLTFNDNLNLSTTAPALAEPIIGLEEEFSTNIVQATVFELPWEVHASNRTFLYVPAIRPNGFITSADYVVKRITDENYSLATESINFCLGLQIVSTIGNTIYLKEISDSPIDVAEVSISEWNNNAILGFNNSEFISIKKLTPQTSATYDWTIDTDDLLRGRLGTEQQTTLSGIIFFDQGAILDQSTIIQPTNEVSIKILPATPGDQITENETVDITTAISGTALNPLPVEDLTYSRISNDVTFEWRIFEKSDTGKIETTAPSYDTEISMDNIYYTTYNFTTVTWTDASPITIYVRNVKDGRYSVKRFITSD